MVIEHGFSNCLGPGPVVPPSGSMTQTHHLLVGHRWIGAFESVLLWVFDIIVLQTRRSGAGVVKDEVDGSGPTITSQHNRAVIPPMTSSRPQSSASRLDARTGDLARQPSRQSRAMLSGPSRGIKDDVRYTTGAPRSRPGPGGGLGPCGEVLQDALRVPRRAGQALCDWRLANKGLGLEAAPVHGRGSRELLRQGHHQSGPPGEHERARA